MIRSIFSFALVLLGIQVVHTQVLIDYSYEGDLTAHQIDSLIGGNPIYDVSVYTVVYTLLDHNDELDTVSGLFLTPVNPATPSNLVVYCHGTSNTFDDVPSTYGQGFPDALSFATAGFTVAATDYIGLGPVRNSFHPYVHARSEALAALYFIDVAYEIMDEIDAMVGPELFVAGYSQGGHSSMALQKLIETEFENDIDITAAVHGSGPYSVSDVMRKLIISGEEYLAVGFIPFLILGYEEAYGNIYNDLSDIFKPGYVPLIQQFEAGTMDLTTLSIQLAFALFFEAQVVAPRYMLQDTIVTRLIANDPSDPLIAALRDNDTYNFEAKTPIRLYYCEMDELVPYENSTFADSAMQVLGADDLEAIHVDPNAGHGDCALGAFPLAIDFFNGFINVGVSEREIKISERIYPNPVGDELKIELREAFSDFDYRIIDMQGRPVMKGSAYSALSTIDCGNLTRGTYVLQLITDRGMETHQLIR